MAARERSIGQWRLLGCCVDAQIDRKAEDVWSGRASQDDFRGGEREKLNQCIRPLEWS
jgi:hypothetical protein